MKNGHESRPDANDVEILEKFNSLLSKYQNTANSVSDHRRTQPWTSMRSAYKETIRPETESGDIPVLTETVRLAPSVIKPHLKRIAPVRQIVAAALDEVNLKLDPHDQEALVEALKVRLANYIK